MSEKRPRYQGFFIEDEPGQDAVRISMEWLTQWGDSEEGVIVTPVADQYRYSRLASLTSQPMKPGSSYRFGNRLVHTCTWRTFPPGSWRGGLVLALWPTEKFLDRLHDERRMEALCVVPSTIRDVSAWQRSVRAVDLASDEGPAEPAGIRDPVVERAMVSLTIGVNQNNRLITPDEKSEAVLTLELLRDGGHRFAAEEVHAWALANGWEADTARQLREYTEGVLAGRRYRINRNIFRRDVLEYWRSEAAT